MTKAKARMRAKKRLAEKAANPARAEEKKTTAAQNAAPKGPRPDATGGKVNTGSNIRAASRTTGRGAARSR